MLSFAVVLLFESYAGKLEGKALISRLLTAALKESLLGFCIAAELRQCNAVKVIQIGVAGWQRPEFLNNFVPLLCLNQLLNALAITGIGEAQRPGTQNQENEKG
jgi:hypothetical protein